MAAQLTYTYDIPSGIPGGKTSIGVDHVITRMNESTGMGYGIAVVKGTNASTQVKTPASGATAADFVGVTVCEAHTEQNMEGQVVIPVGRPMSVMVNGAIWGKCDDASAPTCGATAYVKVADGTFTATEGSNVDIGAKFGALFDGTTHIAEVILK